MTAVKNVALQHLEPYKKWKKLTPFYMGMKNFCPSLDFFYDESFQKKIFILNKLDMESKYITNKS